MKKRTYSFLENITTLKDARDSNQYTAIRSSSSKTKISVSSKTPCKEVPSKDKVRVPIGSVLGIVPFAEVKRQQKQKYKQM